MALITRKTDAETRAVIGIVSIQAPTIFRAIPHLTAESLSVAPTPIIDEDITCVVLTGIPSPCETPNKVMAPAVSAAAPSTGVNFVILVPIVLTILHPPTIVPSAMAV